MVVEVLGACLLIVLACALAEASNLLPNGDFAADSDKDGLADKWQFSGDRTDLDVTCTREKGSAGGYCQQVTCTRFEGQGGDHHVMLVQQDTFALRKDHWYRLSFRARGEMPSKAASVAIVQTDPWEGLGLSDTFRVKPEWLEQSFVFRARKDIAKKLRLQIWFNEAGTLALENAQLVEVDESARPRLRYTDVVPDLGAKNLLPNGSFECGTSGWGSTAPGVAWGSSSLNTLFGRVDSGVAIDRGCSFRIDLAKATAPVLAFDYFNVVQQPVLMPLLSNRGWITVTPGEEYTFSASVKADPAKTPVAIRISQARAETLEHDTTAAGDWQRVSFTFRPTSDQLYVGLGPNLTSSDLPRTTLWIDAVQLEKGAQATEYEPRSPLEVGVQWERPGHLFTSPEEARVIVTAANQTTAKQSVQVHLDVTDFFDRPAASPQLTLSLAPGEFVRKALPLGVSDKGFYRFRVETSAGAVIPTLAERFGVVDAHTDRDGMFGMNHAYPAQELLPISKEFGLTWYRDWSLKWHQVEPEKGRFDFSQTDYQIDRVRAADLNVLGLLPFPSSEWSTTAPAQVEETHDMREHARLAYKPRDLDEWADYVRATVRHYQNRIHVWEILNEPLYTSYALPSRSGYTVKDYIDLLKVAYQTIKKVDPRAFVVGGIAGGASTYTKEFIEAGGLEFLDALNIHIYPVFQVPEGHEQALQTLTARMQEAGRPKPLYYTEGSYYGDDDIAFEPYHPGDSLLKPVESELECASYQVRFNIILLAQGTRKFVYHSGTHGSLNNPSVGGIFFEWDGAPRKMAITQSVMSALFGADVEYLGQVWEQVRSYAFHSRKRTIIAVWDEKQGHHTLTPRAGVEVRDLAGGAIRDRVEVGGTPYYVVMEGERTLAEVRQAL